MAKNKIPSAEEFARREYDDNRPADEFMERQVDMKHALWMMNVHAKRHTKAALEAAWENHAFAEGTIEPMIEENSILNAYPENLIQ